MLKFTAGVTKGNIDAGYVFNDPFHLGKVDPNYTSSRVVKNFTATSQNNTSFTMEWKPFIEGTLTITVTKDGTTKTYVDVAGTQAGKGSLTEVGATDSVTRRTVMVQPVTEVSGLSEPRFEGTEAKVETVVTEAGGGVKSATATDKIDYATGVIDLTDLSIAEDSAVEVAYSY